jgi:hypothetical protein
MAATSSSLGPMWRGAKASVGESRGGEPAPFWAARLGGVLMDKGLALWSVNGERTVYYFEALSTKAV